MSKNTKIILTTAVATTAFWVVVLVGLYWLGPGITVEGLGFFITDSESGAVLVRNVRTQSVTVTVQELANGSVTQRSTNPPILSRQLFPGQQLGLAVQRTEKGVTEP